MFLVKISIPRKIKTKNIYKIIILKTKVPMIQKSAKFFGELLDILSKIMEKILQDLDQPNFLMF